MSLSLSRFLSNVRGRVDGLFFFALCLSGSASTDCGKILFRVVIADFQICQWNPGTKEYDVNNYISFELKAPKVIWTIIIKKIERKNGNKILIEAI